VDKVTSKVNLFQGKIAAITEVEIRVNMAQHQTATSQQVLDKAMDRVHRDGIQTSMTSRGRFLHIRKAKQNNKWVIRIKSIKTAVVVSNTTKLRHTIHQASNSLEGHRVAQVPA